MASPEAQAAFDINREPDRVRDAYGRTPFGQRALLARRLVEAGVPFVTLYDGGWDHHSDTVRDARDSGCRRSRQTIAALIEDLDQRGLLDSTLVIALGEFGRTPQINKDAGRDHWSNAMSVLFAGGGTPGGQVVGATDVKGYSAVRAHPVAGELRRRRSTRSSASTRPRSSTPPTAGRYRWSATRRRSGN